MNSGRDTVITALNFARMGDVERGTGILREMCAQPEFEADAYYGLGLIELCLDRVESSKANFRKAIAVEPAHADSYYQLAKIAESLGDSLAAKKHLEAAVAQKPGHVMATIALAEHCSVREN